MFLNQRFLYLCATLWAEGMGSAQSSTTLSTGEPHAGFEVLDCNGAPFKVYILNPQAKRLADTAAKAEKKVDEQLVSETGCLFLHLLYLMRFDIDLHGDTGMRLKH